MTIQFTGIRDFGYRQAEHEDTGLDFARWAVANIPGFPENLSDDNKRILFAGYLMRKQEITPPLFYKRTGKDQYEQVDADGKDVVVLDIDYAFSYSQQQYGALKKEQPNLHGMLGGLRVDGSKYCSGKMRALVRKVSELNPKKRERGTTLSFHDWLEELAASIVPKAKAAANRGDTTAPSPDKAKAIAAAMLKASK